MHMRVKSTEVSDTGNAEPLGITDIMKLEMEMEFIHGSPQMSLFWTLLQVQRSSVMCGLHPRVPPYH